MLRPCGSWRPALLGLLTLIIGVTPLDALTRQNNASARRGLAREVSPGAVHRPKAAARTVKPRADRTRPPAVSTADRFRSPWPVRGPINSDFGARRRSWWRHRVHSGIDIGAPHGTAVRAPTTGRVVFAGWQSGYGRTIVIDHGHRVHTLYAHLSKVRVSRGQVIKPGSTIGSTGNTGSVTGPHLHYEVLVNGHPRNPRTYLTDGRGTR